MKHCTIWLQISFVYVFYKYYLYKNELKLALAKNVVHERTFRLKPKTNTTHVITDKDIIKVQNIVN